MSHGLEAGTVVSMRVGKELAPYGYFMTDGDQEVLLHYTQVVGEIQVDDELDVYLYHDAQDRLSATMKHAFLKLGEVGLLEVVDIHPRFGSFLEMGLGRQLLLPFREQPEMKELRPIVGDKVYVVLSQDRQGRLIAKLAGEDQLIPLAYHAPTAWKNQWVMARVYKPLQLGSFVVCEGGILGGFGAIGLIHSTERTELVRLGQLVEVRVIFVREDGRANLSMRPLKEVGRDEDSETILAYIKLQADQMMPLTDASSVEAIFDQFNISKSSFKRALGKLMRNGLVVQKDNGTYLKQTEE
ncbi:RNA-binding protein [Paenibacillus psychroresistens]|uniref:RNA-binding protein n=1 Tax=Paenibacillus psychroresistens TaxID=1778678 RepID=A0A6B8RJU2_9BACL|nr:S1-like domain-containing RNA-binding protein [Paenibacillus psychroresistens]QGQ95676.1 RNA-binding protein [Paenibacillus psychroresistens]